MTRKPKKKTNDDDKNVWCPCGNYEETDDKGVDIGCEFCELWWHSNCVGLKGLTKESLDALKEWKCPKCIMKELCKDGQTTLEETVKAEVTKTIPTIVKAVVEETMKAKEFNKSFSDLFKNKQEKFEAVAVKTIEKTMHTAIKSNQTELLQKASEKQDADNFEREKRKKNIVLTNVRESKMTNSTARYNSDVKKIVHLLNIKEENVVRCTRAGPPKENNVARPLIVTLSTPEMAMAAHNYGYGQRLIVGSDENVIVWCNPDLIKSDRIANYNARKLQREKKEKMEEKKKKMVQVKDNTAVNKKNDGYGSDVSTGSF